MNSKNELTRGRSVILAVAGVADLSAWALDNVTVSGTGLSSGAADLYEDGSWARRGATLQSGNNTYTALAKDTLGRESTDAVSVYSPASVTFTYDLNGNLTGDGLRVFEYDYENQLTNVYVANQWRSEFAYDALMRRRVRKEFTWSGSAWIKTNEVRYVYDGRLVIQERDENNIPRVTYTRGLDLSGSLEGAGGIGGLLARSEITNHKSPHAYYHADGNGNITCLVDTTGTVVARYAYDPYGNILSMSGSLAAANLYRFSSKEAHQNSGLVYYLYRYYDPNLQSWINQDPIGERGGINLYGFVANKPVAYLDHFGWAILFVPPGWQGPAQEGDTIVPCPKSPLGVSLHRNMVIAATNAKPVQQYPMTNLGPTAGKYIWFYNQVKKYAPWDYKNQPTPGAHPEYEDFGNFNYGATGSASGMDSLTLQNAAGIAQQKDPDTKAAGEGTPGPYLSPEKGIPPYGDERNDNDWIKMGVEYNEQFPAGKGAGPCG